MVATTLSKKKAAQAIVPAHLEEPLMLFWDLFCGAGGFSEGAETAELAVNIDGQLFDRKVAHVINCVNHDANAIRSHEANHPNALHFTEDIRTLDLTQAIDHTKIQLSYYTKAKLCLFAGVECTNHSKAKGGKARDGDSRTLAEHLFRYVDDMAAATNGRGFDMIFIENVEEFMMWGPIDSEGKPIAKDKGRDFKKWVADMESRGYKYDYRLLNAADFGAYTSRRRYFGVFVREGIPFVFPQPTHAKNPKPGSNLQKWKAVKDVLDFTDEGESIFTRKKPLSEKTLARIHAGLIKYVANGETSFIKKYYSGRPAGKVTSTDSPSGTITTVANQALVQPICMLKYNSTSKSGKHIPPSLDNPSPVVSTQGRLGVISGTMLSYQYGNGYNTMTDVPAGTLTTKDRIQKIDYLMFPQWGLQCSHSIEKPSPTLVAKMDKMCPYLLTAEGSDQPLAIAVYETDSPMTVKIKEFMAEYGLIDVKMRMLRIKELKKITGMKEDYTLIGTQAEQKKYIGNAVVVDMARALVMSFAQGLLSLKSEAERKYIQQSLFN